MIKAILFDMDGVLVDSEPYYIKKIQERMEKLGAVADDAFYTSLIGSSNQYTRKALRSLLPEFSDEEFNSKCTNFYDDIIPYHTLIFPDTLQTLKALKEKGYKLALCSSSKRLYINQAVELCQMDNFDYIISGEKLKESKPNPEIYLLAAKHLGVQPNECLVVEDSDKGIEAGKRAKMKVVAIKDTRFGIDQSQADILIDHLSDLLPTIKCFN